MVEARGDEMAPAVASNPPTDLLPTAKSVVAVAQLVQLVPQCAEHDRYTQVERPARLDLALIAMFLARLDLPRTAISCLF